MKKNEKNKNKAYNETKQKRIKENFFKIN